ncbi:MAG TPA: hypothetical protein VGZ29_17190 [Terriglobia bacterium]|nr:hypothetical protein [Terriglobia bacterium]
MVKSPKKTLVLGLLLVVTSAVGLEAEKRGKSESAQKGGALAPAVLWRWPTDIASRNLFYGPGGEKDAPHSVFTFVKEDLDGTNPKIVVRDEHGVKWKVKLGVEAQPEVAATRLVWAVGYPANEDYFLPEMRVQGLPPHLHRGRNLVRPGGSLHNVRLKRYVEGEKKAGDWRWRENPFTGTRELEGLRVMMALINNWDLKDENTSVYLEKRPREYMYMVSDLGASFGTTGRSWTATMGKGNLGEYERSRFISEVTPQYVDFNMPTRPALLIIFKPKDFIERLQLRWIGKHIPRADVDWIAGLLAQLSPAQIQDAFRAAGYTPEEVRMFSSVVQKRIADVSDLPRS